MTLALASESHSVVSNSLLPHGLYSPWNSLGLWLWQRFLKYDTKSKTYY